MNGKAPVVVEQEDDHFEHVPRPVRSDDQDLRWVGVGIEVDHDDRVLDRVQNVLVGESVSMRRPVDLHTGLV